MQLYTIDINVDDLMPTKDPMFKKKIKDKKAIRDAMRDKMFQDLFSGEKTTWEMFNQDPEFLELRKYVDPRFEELFKLSYDFYIAGDWKKAGMGFKKLVQWRPKDGPSINLNKVINIRNRGVAPADWKGFRPLTSK